MRWYWWANATPPTLVAGLRMRNLGGANEVQNGSNVRPHANGHSDGVRRTIAATIWTMFNRSANVRTDSEARCTTPSPAKLCQVSTAACRNAPTDAEDGWSRFVLASLAKAVR